MDKFESDATLYLELAGLLIIAWQWLLQATVATRKLDAGAADPNFYRGKIATFQYFYVYELPKMNGTAQILRNSNGFTADMDSELLD